MGKNPRTSSQPANVRIKVQRNEQAPVFQNEESYVKDINRNQDTNAEIVTVRATDEDTTVLFLFFLDFRLTCMKKIKI